MKKIFSLLFMLAFTVAVFGQSILPRFGTTPNQGNTGAMLNYRLVKYTFVSGPDTLVLSPNAWETVIAPDSLADSLIVKIKSVKSSYLGDIIYITAVAKGASRKIKLPTVNSANGGTLTCLQNKRVTIILRFDGVMWVEVARYVQS